MTIRIKSEELFYDNNAVKKIREMADENRVIIEFGKSCSETEYMCILMNMFGKRTKIEPDVARKNINMIIELEK